MLAPEFKQKLTYGIEKIMWDVQEDVVKYLGARIGENYSLSPTEIRKLLAANELGLMYSDLITIIGKHKPEAKKEIKAAFESAVLEQAAYDGMIYGHKVKMTAPMAAIVQAEYEMTLGEFNNYCRSTADAACTSYFAAVDKAYNQTVSGLKPWTQAFYDAVDEIGQGVMITYPSGTRTTPEVAVARALRTGVAQMASQITATRAAEFGVTLFLTSAHDGARPTHEPWQGQVFWVDWKELAGRIPISLPDQIPEATPEEKAKYKEFCVTTDIGDVAGLEGANCRHSYGPFFEGQKNPYAGRTYDQKKYDLEQKARGMERAIRKQKRQYEAEKAAHDKMPAGPERVHMKTKIEAREAKLRDKVNKYYDFCEANKIKTPQEFRLYIGRR